MLRALYFPLFNKSYPLAAAKSLQLCLTLCDPIEGSLPGFPFPGILQARALEWVAISFSNAWKWKVKVKSLSRVRLLATPWTAAHQAPLSMRVSRQEFRSGVPLPSYSLATVKKKLSYKISKAEKPFCLFNETRNSTKYIRNAYYSITYENECKHAKSNTKKWIQW